MRMIAIDLGSNTLRVTEMDCHTGEFGASFEKIVKTADGLADRGSIHPDAVERVISAIYEAKDEIDFSSGRVRAVTTEALRRAVNADAVLAEIREKTGVIFEIISGEEEAELTLLAVEHRLDLLYRDLGSDRLDSFVLIDIGGGSTELIFCYPHKRVTRSFPIGIVTVAQQYLTLEAIAEAIPIVMREMQIFTDEVYSREGIVDRLVATAGTPTTVAAMKLGQNYADYDPRQINGSQLSIRDLDRELEYLLSLPFAQRETIVGVGRSDLIAAGILIFKHLLSIVGMDQCVVIDDGLREGVALQSCIESECWV
ncbi:MAG: phosphatase [Campylobacterota bacterium]|nr:phosphatase [Campylobacterota bacterium]